jgi:hypothetical protein
MNKFAACALLVALSICTIAEARIKVTGRGVKMNFSPEGIPDMYKPSFDLMETKCIKCHTMERTVMAIQTGVAPITGQPFNKQAVRAYGIKMLRKPNSDMNKKEIRDIVVLLNYFLDENTK